MLSCNETSTAMTELAEVQRIQAGLMQVLSTIRGAHGQRMADRVRDAHASLERSIDSGSHGATTLSLLALIAEGQNGRRDTEMALYDRLTPYVHALQRVVDALCGRYGLELPPPPSAAAVELPMRKRMRPDDAPQVVASQRDAVVALLREDPPPNLSSAEHRLLSTVVPESALLPDVAAMFDIYHPNVTLYDDSRDRTWEDGGGDAVHLTRVAISDRGVGAPRSGFMGPRCWPNSPSCATACGASVSCT